jgi:ABC-2 type transport system ATP-binding protein
MESILRFVGTAKTFRSDLAGRYLYTLGPLDFEVRQGEIFGYLGPNGAGKTTTIQIYCFGHPPQALAARKRIGFLPEQPYFYQHLTAWELMDFYGRLFALDSVTLRTRIASLLRMVGLEGHRDTRLSKFSKGMLQRIGLAQTLINDPDMVILDEPLSGLDPVGRREIRDLTVRLKNEGRTVFFSSHILQDVEMICDRVAILASGKILKTAAVSDVLYESVTSYEIVASNAPIAVISKLGLGRISTRGDKTIITMPARGDLNSGLKRLMALGVWVEAVSPLRHTLEDYFMRELEGRGYRAPLRRWPGQRSLAGTSKRGES